MHYTKLISSLCLFSFASAVSLGAVASESTTDEQVVKRIVNGSAAAIQSYPSFASLFYDTYEFNNVYSRSPFCGAAIIDPYHIVTAAHCVEDDRSVQMFMTVVPQLQNEQDYPFGNIQRHRVAEIYYPDDFINQGAYLFPNDIAVLKLETEMNIDALNDVINMPVNESYRQSSSQFTAVGHGNTRSGADTSTSLLATTLTYVSNAICRSVYLNGHRLSEKQLCLDGATSSVTNLKNSTCQGDSGGPVYWQSDAGQQVLVGLTSFGPSQCGDPNVAVTSVFTEVSDYQGWISQVVAGNATPKVTITPQQREDYFNNGGNNSNDNGFNNGDSGFSATVTTSGASLSWWWLAMLGVMLGMRRKQKG